MAIWDLLFGNYNGQPGSLLFGSKDGTYLGKVDKPVVTQGRMFNPRAADEVVIDENSLKQVTSADGTTVGQAPHVGSTFTYQFYSSKQSDEDTEPPRGLKIKMHIVGVVREVPEFAFVSDGQVLMSPGLLARYGGQIQTAENADVKLRHGEADMGKLRHDVNQYLIPGTPVLDSHATSRRVTTTLTVETTALLLLALAILLGGGILVAQVLGRSASIISDDALPLRGFGMSRGQLGLATGLAHLLPALVAAPVAFMVSLLASPHFPVGLGRRVDPDVGYHIDWTVVGPGIAVAMVAVVTTSILIGRGSTESHRRAHRTPGAFRQWAPITIGLGTTMAFEPGRGRRRIPVVPALLAATVAVTGVVASLSIDQGITTALDHPALAGITFDAGVTPVPQAQTGRNISIQLADRIEKAKEVRATAVIDRAVINVGHVGAPVFTARPMAGMSTTGISFTLTSGRAPKGMGEAAIGPATANDLHVGIGDVVPVGPSNAHVRIVGEALFPSDVHSEFDEGLWLAPAQFDAVEPPIGAKGSLSDERLVAVRFAPRFHLAAAITQLQSKLGPLTEDISPPDPPDELLNLQNVRTLPEVLAGFLGLIAVVALGSVLLSCARRRGHDFAVLRALGMTRGNIRMVLNSQGAAIALFGLVVGIPLGLAVGRLGWRAIAERVPLSVIAPFAAVAALLLIPLTLLVANALALLAGRDALSHLPAGELRAE